MRLLHVSDLHMTGDQDVDRGAVLEAFLTDIEKIHAETPIDLVLFSGDLTFSGKPEEFDRANTDFLQPLMTKLGCDASKIIIAPGNHDVDRDMIDEMAETGLLENLKSHASITDLFDAPGKLSRYLDRLEGFSSFHKQFYADVDPSRAHDLSSSHQVEIDGQRVGVCALSTVWRATGRPDDIDRGHLILGARQVTSAWDSLDECDLLVAVLHHPLDWLASFDLDEAKIELEGRFDLILSGHLHQTDPEQIASVRGNCVYSRAGSLYRSPRYLNAYSLIDIAPPLDTATISLRSYWSDRRVFDVATNIAEDGKISLALKLGGSRPSLPAIRVPYSAVRRSLVEIAGEMSVLTDRVSNNNDAAHVEQILVPPRLLPMPYAEAVAASEPGEPVIPRLDPIEVLEEHQCALVVGGPETGLTSALLWILDRHFDIEPGRFPVYVRFQDVRAGRNPLDRAIRNALSRLTNVPPNDDLPPLVVAVDDVDPDQAKAFRRVVAHIASNPQHKYILSCPPSAHAAIITALADDAVGAARAFLAPFGRRELKALVEKIVGSRDKRLVDQVLSVLGRTQMPRTPFLMAALVVVLIEAEEFARGESSGETAILDAYATLLLRPGTVSPRQDLDSRNYEHILSCLAEELITRDTPQLRRVEAEEFLVEYWKTKGWTTSAAKVLDSLIQRRMLSEDDTGIRFRHPALLFLFAGKRMLESPYFRALAEADPLSHSVTYQHAAALDRSDPKLLEIAAEVLERVLQSIDGVDASLFDFVTYLDGWSFAPNLQTAARALGLPAVPDEVIDQQLDDMYDTMSDPDEIIRETSVNPLAQLAEAVELLSNVLRSSELVDDVELKTDMLRRSLDGWSVAAVALAMEEARTNEARDLVAAIITELLPNADPDKTRQRAEQVTRVLLTLLVGFGALRSLGTVKMLDMLRTLLDDESWFESTAHALFSTFVYFDLGGPQRAKYLAALLAKHGQHPLVRELVRHTAVHAYHRTAFGNDESTHLENILVDVTLIDHPVDGVTEKSRARSLILTNLRKARQLSRGGGSISLDALDDLASDDNPPD